MARKHALAHYYRLQHQAILAYGGYACACCGVTEPLFLTLDHAHNDGSRHRARIAPLSGGKLYRWLRDNAYPPGFQVLCANCNHGRFRNGGVCPHKDRLMAGPAMRRPPRRSPRGSRTGSAAP